MTGFTQSSKLAGLGAREAGWAVKRSLKSAERFDLQPVEGWGQQRTHWRRDGQQEAGNKDLESELK